MDLSKNDIKVNDIFEQMVAIAGSDPAKLKKIELAQNIYLHAKQTAIDLKGLANYEKKQARIFRKGKYSKRESLRLQCVFRLKQLSKAIEVYTKQQQPVSRQTFTRGGIANVEEVGKELIVR